MSGGQGIVQAHPISKVCQYWGTVLSGGLGIVLFSSLFVLATIPISSLPLVDPSRSRKNNLSLLLEALDI